MKKLLVLIFLIACNVVLWAQDSSSKSSDWNEYYSFHNNFQITTDNDRIYSANPNAIFYIQKSENTLHHLSKNNGLSDVGITSFAVDPSGLYLIVGYGNGNIDIVFNGHTTNIIDLKSRLMSCKKNINSITFLSNKAFLATSFGIIVLDYQKAQLEDTYFLSAKGEYIVVNKLYSDTSTKYIYAATMSGVYYCKYGQSNLADFNNWTTIPAFVNIACNSICYFDSTLYINTLTNGIDSFFIYKNGIKTLFKKQYKSFRNIHAYQDKLLIIGTSLIEVYDNKLLLKQVIDSANVVSPEFHDACFDQDGLLWFNEKVRGLFRSTDKIGNFPQSPVSDFISSIRSANDNLIVTHGVQWRYYESKISFYNLNYNSWIYSIDWSYSDPLNSVSLPNERFHFFVGSWGKGVIEYNDWWNPINRFNTNTKSLGSDYVNDLKIDSNKNLFVYTARNNLPFSVYTKKGEWYRWNYKDFTKVDDQSEIFIDKNNWKWVVAYDGIFVFNDKNTPLDLKDDDTKFIPLSDNSGEMISSSARSMAIDLTNVLWVGTISGLGYYSNVDNVFGDSKPILSRNKITVNGVVDYLLASESINCIAIDAANRKWIGTNSGLFLVSSNGTEVLKHFTVDNSPLPSNAISCLKIITEKSEILIGTYSGLVGYNIGIHEAKPDLSEISIYPNPVKHDYTGLIRFEGLMEKTTIKLLDINGNLVYETLSEGGTAFWNGNNLVGQRVASGVYVVVLVNSDQTQKKISKIIFIH